MVVMGTGEATVVDSVLVGNGGVVGAGPRPADRAGLLLCERALCPGRSQCTTSRVRRADWRGGMGLCRQSPVFLDALWGGLRVAGGGGGAVAGDAAVVCCYRGSPLAVVAGSGRRWRGNTRRAREEHMQLHKMRIRLLRRTAASGPAREKGAAPQPISHAGPVAALSCSDL